jgi:hypothetical protein
MNSFTKIYLFSRRDGRNYLSIYIFCLLG